MELLDRYLQSVKFWLPKAQQDDILKELNENIRSQMEDKEGELGRPLSEAEQSAILKRHGHPILVASRYWDRQHLIGPALFPIYWFVLRLVLVITVASSLISQIATASGGKPAGDIVLAILQIPNVVGKSGLHGRSNPQRLVNPAEVVMHEIDRQRVRVVFHLFAKGVGQPSKATLPHADVQVHALNV